MRWRCGALLLALSLALVTGCVTVAEFRKLERQVIDLRRGGSSGDVPRQRLAALAERLDALEREADSLLGRLEVAEHHAQMALAEARTARLEIASEGADAAPASGDLGDSASPRTGTDAGDELEGSGGATEEVAAYRAGYAEWRRRSWGACIDHFRIFLQTYPSSAYADDAAYWLADCYFKQGDYKTAVLRFDDVVARYPSGNKAPDALFRQGEALLRLGPGYGKAAGKAFERVVKEYPDSARAGEAKKQLALLGAG